MYYSNGNKIISNARQSWHLVFKCSAMHCRFNLFGVRLGVFNHIGQKALEFPTLFWLPQGPFSTSISLSSELLARTRLVYVHIFHSPWDIIGEVCIHLQQRETPLWHSVCAGHAMYAYVPNGLPESLLRSIHEISCHDGQVLNISAGSSPCGEALGTGPEATGICF